MMPESTNLDLLLRVAVIVNELVDTESPTARGMYVKISSLFADDEDLQVWFNSFFKSLARRSWLENSCKMTIHSSGSNRQLFLSNESIIAANTYHELQQLDEVFQPPAAIIPVAAADDDDDDKTWKIGQRKAWVEMGSETQAKAVRIILPAVEAVVKSHVHANIHGELGAVMMEVAYAVEKKEAQIIDKENRMRIEGSTRVVKGLVRSYIDAPERYVSHVDNNLFSLCPFHLFSSPGHSSILWLLSRSCHCTISAVLCYHPLLSSRIPSLLFLLICSTIVISSVSLLRSTYCTSLFPLISHHLSTVLHSTPLLVSYSSLFRRTEQRMRILSCFSSNFTMKGLNKYAFKGQDGVVISSFLKRVANEHAAQMGPGRDVEAKAKAIRNRMDSDAMSFLIQFLMQYKESHACGFRYLDLDRPGCAIQVPKTTSKESPEFMKAAYAEEVAKKVAQGDYIEQLCPAHVDEVIESLFSGEQKSLAAIDSVWKKCFDENGARARRLIDIITVGRPVIAAQLKSGLDKAEIFLHREYAHHMSDDGDMGCGAFSYSHAFGEEDFDRSDDLENELFSDGAMSTEIWRQNMLLAIKTMSPLPDGHADTPDTLRSYFEDTIITDYRTYVAHIVRKAHESDVYDVIVRNHMNEETVIVRLDWKMKVLSMTFRESMTEFFGKRGMSVMGVQIMYMKNDEELSEDEHLGKGYRSKMNVEFFDMASDDSKEDCYSATQMLEKALLKFKELHKEREKPFTKAYLLSDGAGCFSGTEFTMFLCYVGKFTGIRIIAHIVSEAGSGKSSLDGHFCYLIFWLIFVVTQGRGDANMYCAEDLARNLMANGGIASTIAASINIVRGGVNEDGNDDDNQANVVGGSLRSLDHHLFRGFNYETDEPGDVASSLALHHMSFRDGEPDMLVTLDELLELRHPPAPSVSIITWAVAVDDVDRKPDVQLTLCEDDRSRKASTQGMAKKRRIDTAAAAYAERQSHLSEVAEASSCSSVYATRLRQMGKNTDRDIIRHACSEALMHDGVVTQIHTQHGPARKLNDEYINYSAAKLRYKLYDGTDAELFVPALGFACKTDPISNRVNSDQLRHAMWGKSLGEKTINPTGSKMFPTQMETSMRLHGTQAGNDLYPKEEHMRVSETGQATFMLCHLLSAQQLKGYAAREQSKLVSQLKNLVKKEEREAEEKEGAISMAAALEAEKIENPHGFRIERMIGKELQAELKKHGLKVSGCVREKKDRLLEHLQQ